MNREAPDRTAEQISVLTSPHWIAAFFAIAVPASLVPFFVGFLLGFSVASDTVFGAYALISGLFADFVLRWKFKKALMVSRKPDIPFNILWVLLCLYVIAFQPLD